MWPIIIQGVLKVDEFRSTIQKQQAEHRRSEEETAGIVMEIYDPLSVKLKGRGPNLALINN